MLAKTIMMKKNMLTIVSPSLPIGEALKVMETEGLLSIPVVDGKSFKGSIEINKIYEKFFTGNEDKDTFLTNNKVEDFLRTDTPTIGANEEIENAVALLEKMNVSFVAVVDKEIDKFLGILTHKAVFKQFTNIFGLNQGDRLSVIAYDVPGQISKLSKIVAENHGDIISFVVINPNSVRDLKEIIIRVKANNMREIKNKISLAGFQVND